MFCGSELGRDPRFEAAARELAVLAVQRGWGLVYGGGRVGLMGALADATLHAGGDIVGVIPQDLAAHELAHPNLTRLCVVGSMHRRKALMSRLAHAYVALPGGYGTLEELFEVVTWAQLGVHHKPIGVLNIAGFYDPVLQAVDHAHRQGFISSRHRGLLVAEGSPAKVLDRLSMERR